LHLQSLVNMGATSHYIHHVNGRLRVRTPFLRQNGHLANEWKIAIEALSGVKMATLNPVTGSIIVYYEPNVTNPEALLAQLQVRNYVPASAQMPLPVPQTPAFALNSDPAKKLMKELAVIVAKKVAERAVVGLVAAVI
jgi:hypothetical protein